MKLKINKASDLSSISVLPPQSRRPNGAENSIFGKNQASTSQLRSQASQQSLSQGISAHQGLFSQLSQNSLDDHIANAPKLNSQEREASVLRSSCLAPVTYPRDESQMQVSRSSANLMRKWSTPEHKCQVSEELEHRLGTMEASLSRMGIIVESLQSDIIQVNKGTRELLLEMQGVRQKMVVHDDFLQLMKKGQEDIKSYLDRSLKALSGKISDKSSSQSISAISSTVSALPQKIETSVLKLQRELEKTFSKEMQTFCRSLKASNKKCATPVINPPKATDHLLTSKVMQPPKSFQVQSKDHQATKVPRVETGGWKTVKHEEATLKDKKAMANPRLKCASEQKPMTNPHLAGALSQKPILNSQLKEVSHQQEKNCEDLTEPDVDTDIFCLFDETGNSSIEQGTDEFKRTLRRARRKKRKHSSIILID
ncbi:OLC1v1000021C1 [Oldenlandia corymbosa var. corymbosa]|uniref:OLC1v1000021C1 n=1 Tax=Oldenlandia corymbosa var. corymbosa TaxID=529605 RepID=A0AAV1D5F6_OLDCO|nr:OLC1v1000021C1 [Oldenlandia corymbosa var. corymbosa]